ncbi:MAG: GNAT family N-acetyltransferase [Dehalococcoidaceae bacterium]|nr:GNAT family N-acetyltransferase [Dehalococcoidaceae bacterium]
MNVKDAATLFSYRSLNEVSRFQGFQPKNLADATGFLNSISPKPNIPNTWYQLGLFHQESNKHIGDIGIHFLDNSAEAEIGCTLAPEYWKQGYAAEGVKAVISFIFNTLEKKIITANIDSDNISSCRLFERFGFKPTSRTDSEFVYQLGGI